METLGNNGFLSPNKSLDASSSGEAVEAPCSGHKTKSFAADSSGVAVEAPCSGHQSRPQGCQRNMEAPSFRMCVGKCIGHRPRTQGCQRNTEAPSSEMCVGEDEDKPYVPEDWEYEDPDGDGDGDESNVTKYDYAEMKQKTNQNLLITLVLAFMSIVTNEEFSEEIQEDSYYLPIVVDSSQVGNLPTADEIVKFLVSSFCRVDEYLTLANWVKVLKANDLESEILKSIKYIGDLSFGTIPETSTMGLNFWKYLDVLLFLMNPEEESHLRLLDPYISDNPITKIRDRILVVMKRLDSKHTGGYANIVFLNILEKKQQTLSKLIDEQQERKPQPIEPKLPWKERDLHEHKREFNKLSKSQQNKVRHLKIGKGTKRCNGYQRILTCQTCLGAGCENCDNGKVSCSVCQFVYGTDLISRYCQDNQKSNNKGKGEEPGTGTCVLCVAYDNDLKILCTKCEEVKELHYFTPNSLGRQPDANDVGRMCRSCQAPSAGTRQKGQGTKPTRGRVNIVYK